MHHPLKPRHDTLQWSPTIQNSTQQILAVDSSRKQQIAVGHMTPNYQSNSSQLAQQQSNNWNTLPHDPLQPIKPIAYNTESVPLLKHKILCSHVHLNFQPNPGFWLVQTEIIAFCQPIRRLPTVQGYSLPTHRETASPWPWHLQISGQKSWNRSRQCFFTSNWDS